MSRVFAFAFPLFGLLWLLITLGLTVFGLYLFWLLATSTKRCADALERIAQSAAEKGIPQGPQVATDNHQATPQAETSTTSILPEGERKQTT